MLALEFRFFVSSIDVAIARIFFMLANIEQSAASKQRNVACLSNVAVVP
jgi:hypothetical protein